MYVKSGLCLKVVYLFGLYVQTNSEDDCSQIESTLPSFKLNGGCVFVPSYRVSWDTASTLCSVLQPNSALLTIKSASEQNTIEQVMEESAIPWNSAYWIGGRVLSARWHWLSDGNPLAHFSGCCQLQENRSSIESTFYSNSPFHCSLYCQSKGHLRFYLQGRLCKCGEIQCHQKPDSLCTSPCPGDYHETCGSNESTSVFSQYQITDIFLSWFKAPSKRPTDHPDLVDDCATLVSGHGRQLFLSSAFCHYAYQAICLYNDSEKNICDRRLSAIHCFQILDKRMSWFDARNACKQNDGELATVYNDSVDGTVLERGSYWFGLRRIDEHWVSGEDILFHSNPLDKRGCMYLRGARAWWETDVCSERKFFLCQTNIFQTKETTTKPTAAIRTTPEERSTVTQQKEFTTDLSTVVNTSPRITDLKPETARPKGVLNEVASFSLTIIILLMVCASGIFMCDILKRIRVCLQRKRSYKGQRKSDLDGITDLCE